MATPEFILKLREKIGHDQLWLIGVTAYVEDGQGRILMDRRRDTGEWALVYGINEPGEEPAETVRREVLEETGVDVTVTEFVGMHAAREETVYANGDRCLYLDLMFCCELAPAGNERPFVGDDESLDTGWFAPDALPEPLAASTRERLGWLAEYRVGDGHAVFGR